MWNRVQAVLVGSLALGPLAGAQDPVALVRVGELLPGTGTVTGIDALQYEGTDITLIVVSTDDPEHPRVVIESGDVWLRQGDRLNPDSPVTLGDFGRFSFSWFSGLYWTGSVNDVSGSNATDVVVNSYYYPHYDVMFAGTEPFGTFPPGFQWRSFAEIENSGGAWHALLRGTLEDPSSPGVEKGFLARAWLEYTTACCRSDPIAQDGDPLPLLGETLERVRLTPGAATLAQYGAFALWCGELVAPDASDGVVLRTDAQWSAVGETTLVAREGQASPVPGRTWGPLERIALDSNWNGDWTLRARLDASDTSNDEVLVLNGRIFAREGDVHPAVAPHALEDLGTSRARLTSDGRVLWFARWDDASGPSEGLFLEDEALVRTSETTVDGVPFVAFGSGPDDYDLSALGQHLLFRGTLADGVEGVFLLDRGGMRRYCTWKKNSAGCEPRIEWSGDAPSASKGEGFFITGSRMVPDVPALLFYGPNRAYDLYAGGRICVGPPTTRLPPLQTVAGGTGCSGRATVDFNAWVATGVDPTLVAGQTVHTQYWYRDPGFPPPEDIGLTQGLRFFLMP